MQCLKQPSAGPFNCSSARRQDRTLTPPFTVRDHRLATTGRALLAAVQTLLA